MTARLDQEIDDFCDLDEYIYPYPYVTDENDLLDLPAQHLWLSQSHDLTLLRAMNVEHPTQVRLDTYGLHNEYVGNRVGHIAHIELANMLRVVSQLWAEYSLGSHMYVFRADPQPEGTPPNTMVLIVEFPMADRDHTFYRATLVDTKLDGRATDRLTTYVPREATVANVADAVNHDGSCWPQGLEECHVMAKLMQYSHQDRFGIRSGDYFIFTVYTFQSRFGLLGNVFQGAHQYARDFLWRSRHYGRQEFTILVHAATQHYERTEPRPLRRTIDDFRHAEELWQDAIQAWATHGANENSQLQAVWPQTIYQSGQENVHIILTIGPIFPWLPILLSVIAHFGHDSPRRIETQAWQVPRQPTVQHLMALTCFWRLSQEQAGDPYIVYSRQQYHGADTVIDIQRGGHYELHLQMPTISTFVLNLAQYFHRIDLEPAADTSEDDERTPPPDGGRDDETALFQGSIIPVDSELEGISLLQKTMTLSTAVVLAYSGYTDIFLDRVWPLTTEGEQQMSPNIDPVDLRNCWQRVSDLHGIPRPVDVALIIICRPYHLGARSQELHITLARFDDPTAIPQEITDHWSDLSETAWRLYPSHHATREARTVDVDGWRFMLLTERQSRGHSFSTGSIEIVSRFQEDEHSYMFTATMTARTSWGHIWSWLRLGDQFFGDHLLQVYLNEVTILAPFASMQLEHGYFLQVIAHSRTQEGYAVIPFVRIQGWCRDFRIAAPSTYGNVYRAGYTLDESGHARLPYHKRDQEIVTSWPDLTVWTKYRVHAMAKGRNPPWFPFDNAQIVHPLPNGVQVAIICSVFEGTGASTYALIFNRIISVQAILSSLKCISRCNNDGYICRTEHNGLQVTLDATIALDEGDFIEVFISSTYFNLDARSIHVADTAPRSEQETTATPTTTSYQISLASDNGAERCRLDRVHWPFVDDPTDRPFVMDYTYSVESESEVARRWSWLRRGDFYPIHPSAILRVPPWNTRTPSDITQHYLMVGQVAILGSAQDGISSKDIAFVARVRSTIIELHGHLQCQQRCLAPDIECVTRHNSRLCGKVLDLQNGDFVEVTVTNLTEQPTGDFCIVTRTDDMSRNATFELRSDCSDPAIHPLPIDLLTPGNESTVSLAQSLLQTNIILTKTNRTTSSVGCNPRRSPRGDLRSTGGVRTANAQLTKELDTHSRNDQWSTHSHVNHTNEHGCRHDIVRRPGQDEEALLGGSRNGQGTLRLYTRSQDIFRQPVCRSDIHPVWDVDAIFYRLQPPGNGAIHDLTDDGQEKDSSNTINTRQIIDVRNRITLDALDDFHITSQHIVICEVTSRKRSVVQLSDPGITDELLHSLMQEWPEDVIDTTFQKIADLHPLAQQYVDGARCFHWDEVEEIHIYCDGSTHFCQETNTQHAGCSIVITATTVSPEGPGYSLLGFTGGTICTDPTSVRWWGAESTQAIDAERTGVLLSLLWILQSPFACGLPCTVVFDCMAAGYGAEGTWNYPSDSTLAEMLRGISQLVTEYLPGLVTYLHTHAHVGDPANELADCIAKSFAKGELPNYLAFLDLEWLVRATHNHGSWIWLYFGSFARVEDLPFIAENQVYLPDNKRCDRVPPNSSLEAHETEGQAKIVTLTLATINVKSLYAGDVNKQDGGSYMPMKAQYLAQQLDWYQYDIVGIQESNSRHTGISQVGSFVRLMGGCTDKGQLGCEIWLNRDRLKFQLHEICVLHTDHRRIFIRIQNNILDFIVGSIHSPHSGAAEVERTGWWNKTQDLCKRYSVMAHLVILADANAQVTQPMDNVTGTLLSGVQNVNEMALLDTCRQSRLCIPSTYEDCHAKEQGTWWHPSGQWIRIDYVLIPQAWLPQVLHSWVDTNLDMGATYDDHRPCGCQLRIMIEDYKKVISFGRYDWTKAQNPQVCEQLRHTLQQIPKIPWDTNVHEHAVQLRDALHETLYKTLGPEQTKRRQSYITDSTWATRTGKKKLKKLLLERESFMNTNWTLWAFEAWRKGTNLIDSIRPTVAWLLKFDRETAHLRRLLLETARELRNNLTQDRTSYAKECALNCQDKPIHLVFKELKKLRVGGLFRKRHLTPLPMLQHPDGTIAEHPTEIAEIWRTHCATLEAGEQVTPEQLLDFVQHHDQHRRHLRINIEDIPTLSCLEKHIRKIKLNKATGCDAVPSNIFHICPSETSRILYPLLLKQAVTIEEALEFKGGLLISAYKGKGKMTAASSYRGLMLTSIAGKAIRSAYREGMLNKYYCYTTEGHFSARARGNVGQAAFVLRLFLRYAKQAQLNCGIIFLDIQHAYYSVCRELASGFTGTDEQLCGIFKHFHLPQQAVHDLQRLISEGSAMDYAGCSDYHKSLLHELGTGTWYRVRNSDKLTQTHGGSRPGDGLADLIFGYIFARMLESMRSEMIEAGIWDATSWKLGVDREQILCTGYKPDRIAANLEICWADDLALALHATSAESLLERIQAVGGFLLRWVKRFGMKPNLQRGKSETLLHLRGPGSKKFKTALFTPDDPIQWISSLMRRKRSNYGSRINTDILAVNCTTWGTWYRKYVLDVGWQKRHLQITSARSSPTSSLASNIVDNCYSV